MLQISTHDNTMIFFKYEARVDVTEIKTLLWNVGTENQRNEIVNIIGRLKNDFQTALLYLKE